MNSGKQFEALFQDSCRIQGISCTRLRDAGFRGEQSERRFTIRNICDFICYAGGKHIWFLELKSRQKRIAFKKLEKQAARLLQKYQENPMLHKCGFLIDFSDSDDRYYFVEINDYYQLTQTHNKQSVGIKDMQSLTVFQPIKLYVPKKKRSKRLDTSFFSQVL
jgi:penicillin-binding protein-related factor A (putative recombinase)